MEQTTIKSQRLHARLSEIQKAIQVPKNNKNSFGGYTYRTCEQILTELKNHTKESELVLLDTKLCHLNNRIYIEAKATFICEGEEVSCVAYAREPEIKKGMDEAQVTGSSTSYARKYALAGLFALDNEDDPDSTNKSSNNEKEKEPTDNSAIKILLINGDFEIKEGTNKEGVKYNFISVDNTKFNIAQGKKGNYGINLGDKVNQEWFNFDKIDKESISNSIKNKK